MASFTHLPVANAPSSSLLDHRPCCVQRYPQRRAGAGIRSLSRPFQAPCQLTSGYSTRGSVRKQPATTCQAVAAPPSTFSRPQNGTGGHTHTSTDHPIQNKEQQTGPKILIAGAGIGGLVLAVGLLKRGFDVKVFEKNITAIRGEGKYRGPIQVRQQLLSQLCQYLAHVPVSKLFCTWMQVQSNALAALEAIDKEMADKILAEGCITGDRINGLVDGETGKW
jgi:hypothetical protein